MKRARERGEEALRTEPRPGRPPNWLRRSPLKDLLGFLRRDLSISDSGARSGGGKRVREVIKEGFGGQVRRPAHWLDSRIG